MDAVRRRRRKRRLSNGDSEGECMERVIPPADDEDGCCCGHHHVSQIDQAAHHNRDRRQGRCNLESHASQCDRCPNEFFAAHLPTSSPPLTFSSSSACCCSRHCCRRPTSKRKLLPSTLTRQHSSPSAALIFHTFSTKRRCFVLLVSRFRRLILHHRCSRLLSSLPVFLLLSVILMIVKSSHAYSSPSSGLSSPPHSIINSNIVQADFDYTFSHPKIFSSTPPPFFADFDDDADEDKLEEVDVQDINQSLYSLYPQSTVRRRQWSPSSSDELEDDSPDSALQRRETESFTTSAALIPLSRHLRHAQQFTTARPLLSAATVAPSNAAFSVQRRALSDGNPYQPASDTVAEDYTQHCERGILFRSSPTHREGWFYAPNVTSRLGKLYYEAKREFKCFYHFLADPDEQLELAFDTFSQFGKPPDCYYEYVDLYTELPEQQQQASPGSSSVFPVHADALAKGWAGRYCGTVPPRLRVSLNNQLALSFSSEFSESRNTTNMPFRGRYKFFKQSERYRFGERDMNALFPQCSWIIRSEELPSGIISTPTYPGVYPRDIECVYRLLGRQDERVQLTFIDMDIFFGGEHCPYDKVDVYDGEGYNCTGCTRIGTFCGLRHNFTIFSSNEDLTVVFSTRDSKSQHRGFRAFYQFDTKFVRLEPGFVDPHDTSGHVTHIRGTECDVQVRSFGLEGTSGVITSPTRPNRMHQPRNDLIRCQYIIDGKDSPSRLERIVLEFEDFRFGMPGAPSCADTNNLNVIIGAPTNMLSSSGGIIPDTNNKTYCDEHKPTQALMSFGPRMVLQYYSADKNYPAYFRARYSFKRDFGISGTPAPDVNSCDFMYHYTCKNELDEDCGQKVGQVRSPRHPKKYPINLNCTYTFQLQPNQELWIVFDVFVFHSSWQKYLSGLQCNEDYVEIYYIYRGSSEGGRMPRERLVNRYCKTTAPAPILSDPDMSAVRIRMVSNRDTGVAVGFRGRYGFRPPQLALTRPCGGLLFGKTHGVLMSPNFPNKYPVDTKCDWRIEVAAGYKVLITINNFELEGNVQSGGCSGAAVQFFHVRPEPAYLNSSQAPYWLPDFVEWQETNLAKAVDPLMGEFASGAELFKEMPLELCGPLKQSKRNRDVLMKPTFLSYDNRARITFTTAAKAVSNRGFQIAWTRVRVVPISSDKFGLLSPSDSARAESQQRQSNWQQQPNVNSDQNSVSAVVVGSGDTPPRRDTPPPLVVSNQLDTTLDRPPAGDADDDEILIGSVLAAGLCNESEEFLCQSVNYVYCLPKTTVCDGVYHCSIRKYSDERQCDYSNLQHQLFYADGVLDGANVGIASEASPGGGSGIGKNPSATSGANSAAIGGGNTNPASHSSIPNYTTQYIFVAVGSVLACLAVFLLCVICFKISRTKSTAAKKRHQQQQHMHSNSDNTAMVANGRIAGSASSMSIRGSDGRRNDNTAAALRSSRSTYSNQSLRQLSASPVGGSRLPQQQNSNRVSLLTNHDNNNTRDRRRYFPTDPQHDEEEEDAFVRSNTSNNLHYVQTEIPPIILNDERPPRPTISITTMSNGGVTATYSVPQTAPSSSSSASHYMSNRAAARFDQQKPPLPSTAATANVQPQNPYHSSSVTHSAQIEQPPSATATPQRGNGTSATQRTRYVSTKREEDPVWMLDSQRSPPPSSSTSAAAANRPSTTHRMTRM